MYQASKLRNFSHSRTLELCNQTLDAALSGLTPFNASGGMKNWKVGLLANQSLSGDLLHGFSIFGLGSYARLVGDFKRSPIVSDRGSAGQWFGGLGLAYSW